MKCTICEKSLSNARSALKDHTYNWHVDEVHVGENLLSVKRVQGTFVCLVCDKALPTTGGFKSHLTKHNLTMRVKGVRGSSSQESYESVPNSENEDEDILEDDSLQLSEAVTHIPPQALIIDNESRTPKKRKLLTYSETILASSDSITAETQEKNDKLMIAKLGRWVPIIYESGSEQLGLLTSARSATLLLQEAHQAGVWKKPVTDLNNNIDSPREETYCNGDDLIEIIKSTSKAARKLSGTQHEECTFEYSNILNRDWLEYPQLRYCGSQILAGAILVEGKTSVLLNTIEPYSRDPLLDAHYERLPAEQSSFPQTPGIYGFLLVCLLDTQDGKKLIIGTRTCNFLVTSSMRLDVHSINIGPTTTHFAPTNKTRVFLDKASLEVVKPMLKSDTINECQQMPILCQLRQVRSKFDCLSTYTKCRASSSLVCHPFLQPTTIWTFSSQNGSTLNNMSQERIGSLFFRTIAVKVCKDGRRASLDRADVDDTMALAKDTHVSIILSKIQGLFGDQDKIQIIGNSALNSQLTDLASKINKKREDEKKIQNVIKILYD